jgi:hypothetical protein
MSAPARQLLAKRRAQADVQLSQLKQEIAEARLLDRRESEERRRRVPPPAETKPAGNIKAPGLVEVLSPSRRRTPLN